MLSEIINIKIRETLREDLGGVYSPYGGANIGYFPRQYVRAILYFDADPERVDELLDAAYSVFDKAKNEISDEDLVKGKEILKKAFDVNLKENNY